MSTFCENSSLLLRIATRRLLYSRQAQKRASRCAHTLSADVRTRPAGLIQSPSAQSKTLRRSIPQLPAHATLEQLTERHHTGMRPSCRSLASTNHEPLIHPLFEATTGTFQYIVTDPSSKAAVIIDPVLDFDPSTSSITTLSADSLLAVITEKAYDVHYILETHAHADHLSAASYLQTQISKTGTRPGIGIGKRIGQVQTFFGKRYGVPTKERTMAFDRLFSDDEVFRVGDLVIQAIHLPGHSPDHIGYKIGSNVFCGDSLFNADIGTARCDFPGGSAHDLWHSSQKLLALPDDTKIWTGHDYPPEGRTEPLPFMTVKQHKKQNQHVNSAVTKDSFIQARTERDAKLAAPKLLHQSLQINIRGGKLPKVDEGGRRMLKIPLNMEDAASL